MVKLDFEFDTPYGWYRDALYLDDDHTYTQEEIRQMELERLANWLYIVENPPEVSPGIVEINGVQYEKVEIDGQIVLKPVGV